MRDIKFRAWLIKEKKMVGVSDLLLAGGGIIQTSCEDSDYDGLSKVVGRDCVLMQYTGLKDKNGKEIYEGDICEVRYEYDLNESDYCEGESKSEVVFRDGCFCFGKSGDGLLSQTVASYLPNNIEVVGNVYENPELLEAKK